MKLSYDKIKAIFKSIMADKINDISFGNLSYEIIEEIEKAENIELPDDLVEELIRFGDEIEIVMPNSEAYEMRLTRLDC